MYTDFVGNPIAAGDHICYGVKSGSSAVNMTLARVREVIPIIPNNPGDLSSRFGGTEEDHLKGRVGSRCIASRAVKDPDTAGHTYKHVRDDSKAYLLKVQRLQDGWGGWMRVDTAKIVTIHNVTNVVVVHLPEVSE